MFACVLEHAVLARFLRLSDCYYLLPLILLWTSHSLSMGSQVEWGWNTVPPYPMNFPLNLNSGKKHIMKEDNQLRTPSCPSRQPSNQLVSQSTSFKLTSLERHLHWQNEPQLGMKDSGPSVVGQRRLNRFWLGSFPISSKPQSWREQDQNSSHFTSCPWMATSWEERTTNGLFLQTYVSCFSSRWNGNDNYSKREPSTSFYPQQTVENHFNGFNPTLL